MFDAVLYFPHAVTPPAAPDPDTPDIAADAAADPNLQSQPLGPLLQPPQQLQPQPQLQPQLQPSSTPPPASAAAAPLSPLLRSLGRAVLGMNHTAVPPTRLLLDLFEVVPTRGNGLGLYRRWGGWWWWWGVGWGVGWGGVGWEGRGTSLFE